MEISFASARYRTAALAGSILIAEILIFQAGRLWLANHWIESGDLARMERGAALVPSDGSAWDTLGHQRQWSFSDFDLSGAIADYQKALHDDPRDAHYWMDLASAYQLSGEHSMAADAYARAQQVYPASAEVAFYYGNFLLQQQDYPAAFAQLRRAVKGDQSFFPPAISRAWRATGDANLILDQLLPARADAYEQALDYFASIHQGDAALAAWSRLLGLHATIPLRSVFPLFDELIRENRSADSQRIWHEALAAARMSDGSGDGSSVLWNGDFADQFTDGGLGWRWSPMPGVYLSFDSAPPQGSGRSLRMDFNDGSNIQLYEPYEYVPVSPGTSYHFRAMMRTDEITTESGLRFGISDANRPDAVNLVTENFIGTHDWTPVEADVTTGPDTNFLVIRLLRAPSRMFDNKLGGTVWIADISLVPSTAPSAAPAQAVPEPQP